ncbi:MAG: hypothetical protein ABIQ33_00205 [Caldimonas sp.]
MLESRVLASRAGVGIIRSRWELMNQDGETVLTMEGYGMFRRPAPPPPVEKRCTNGRRAP